MCPLQFVVSLLSLTHVRVQGEAQQAVRRKFVQRTNRRFLFHVSLWIHFAHGTQAPDAHVLTHMRTHIRTYACTCTRTHAHSRSAPKQGPQTVPTFTLDLHLSLTFIVVPLAFPQFRLLTTFCTLTLCYPK